MINKNTNTEVAVKTINGQVLDDLKHSVLIVSVVLNLFMLSAWLALQIAA